MKYIFFGLCLIGLFTSPLKTQDRNEGPILIANIEQSRLYKVVSHGCELFIVIGDFNLTNNKGIAITTGRCPQN